nr:hypothetical protein [Methanothrix sp.]
MKRSGRDVPTGVFILAGLFFLRGFHSLLIVLFGIIVFVIALLREGFEADMAYITELVLEVSIYAVMGGLFVLCGSWLISLQPRGWKLATAGSAVYLVLVLANIYLGGSSAGLWHAVIAGIILVY